MIPSQDERARGFSIDGALMTPQDTRRFAGVLIGLVIAILIAVGAIGVHL